jgi:asparagine synthase (glutamine-hydrolysing)
MNSNTATRATSPLHELIQYKDPILTFTQWDVKARYKQTLAGIAWAVLTATLPAHLKVRGLEKRHLFKRAFRDLLPPEILAKLKHGFGIPTGIWLNSHPGFRELARDTLLAPRTRQRGYVRPRMLERFFELHATDGTAYYGDLPWTVLMLELWHRRHTDQAAPA